MARIVRKLRHWKQRFDKNAEFIWRRHLTYAGKPVAPGDPIPEELKVNPTKLRRFWESRVIELAEFEAPNVATGQKPSSGVNNTTQDDLPAGVVVENTKGSWFLVRTAEEPDGIKVNGKRKLEELLEELRLEKAEDDGVEPKAEDDGVEPKAEDDGVEPKAEDDGDFERAREDNGQFKADDPATPDVNEAWKDGVAPDEDDDFLA